MTGKNAGILPLTLVPSSRRYSAVRLDMEAL
jgi:hypothetical protein